MSLHLLRGLPFSSTGKPLKVRSKEVVYLQYSRVHRFADVYGNEVSIAMVEAMQKKGAIIPRLSCSQTFAFIPTP